MGFPSHDCIAYVISGLSPKAFQACFVSWTRAVSEATGGEVVAVDGKTARGSRDRRRGKSALHMVSAWGCRNRLVLGQEATAEKSNEITAIPKLLELLGTQRLHREHRRHGLPDQHRRQIVAQGADYVLGLKGNQGTLHDEVEEFFATALAGGFAGVAHDYTRKPTRITGAWKCAGTGSPRSSARLSDASRWSALRSIGLVERECWSGDRHTVERRLFINSIPADAKRFAHAVRGHWGVENRLHWRLDVVFNEDASRIRKGNAPAIMTTIRHLCMNLFEQEPSR
jgi:predicted transposase YbfD/YdcC